MALLGAACILGIGLWRLWPAATRDEPRAAALARRDASLERFAELDPRASVVLERDPERPDRIQVVYAPTSRGEVTFCVVGRDGEWSDRVADDEVGEDHVFPWPTADLKPGDVIRVTFRRGDSFGIQELRVDEARHAITAAPQGLYARRTLGDRKAWIGQYGGSEASETAVADALEWLARHQADDGSWSDRCLGTGSEAKCEKDAPCSSPGGAYEMALSGLALLAFQAGGHYDFNGNRYSENVRRALDWMIARQRSDGGLLGSKQDRTRRRQFYPQFMYEHGIATFALADACAVSHALGRPKNERYAEALGKALKFIEEMQHDDGGWRYTERREQPSDTSVTGWPMLALKSAREAGVSLDARQIEKIRAFFEARATGERGRTGYLNHGVHTEATTGVGMLARQFLLEEPDSPYVREAADYLAQYAEQTWPDRRADAGRSDYYLWYNCTLAMFQAGGEAWKRWNDVVRDTIVSLQRHEGCQRGSWDPDSRWGSQGGRIYSTALAALTLEVYYRYASLSEAARQADGAKSDTAFPLIRRRGP